MYPIKNNQFAYVVTDRKNRKIYNRVIYTSELNNNKSFCKKHYVNSLI